MARIPRLVVPGYPHHVTQRGVRKQRTFFSNADYRLYLSLISEAKPKAGIDILAYCLMPNHVHFVVIPSRKDSLAMLFKEAHRRYTRRVNLRSECQGHLWQERFHSVVMDENHLFAAVRYVEQNPVRAGLCSEPDQWKWSSVSAHLKKSQDPLVNVEYMIEKVGDWRSYLAERNPDKTEDSLRRHSSSGRPIGDEKFLDLMEKKTGVNLKSEKRGRPRNK